MTGVIRGGCNDDDAAAPAVEVAALYGGRGAPARRANCVLLTRWTPGRVGVPEEARAAWLSSKGCCRCGEGLCMLAADHTLTVGQKEKKRRKKERKNTYRLARASMTACLCVCMFSLYLSYSFKKNSKASPVP